MLFQLIELMTRKQMGIMNVSTGRLTVLSAFAITVSNLQKFH